MLAFVMQTAFKGYLGFDNSTCRGKNVTPMEMDNVIFPHLDWMTRLLTIAVIGQYDECRVL